MRYPWVNIALLFLLGFQILTGFLGLVTGNEALHWIIQLHDLGGYAIAVLLLWKGVIIFDVLSRVRHLNVARSAFLLMTGLLLLILATGLVWPWVGYASSYGFSLMTIHALLTIALGGLLLWHTLARRFVLRFRYVGGRRAFLRFAGIAVAGVFFSQLAEVANAALHLPGSARRFTGSYQAGEPGQFPVVSWLLDFPPPVDVNQWRLVVDGQVEHPSSFSYDQLKELASDSLEETIDCTGGWYSKQEWRGVNLARLLESAGVKDNAQ
ncbi:MAG TPA: molybdopterin-dependent oxidoreductase, partial [Anaerolineae bacterium]